MNPISGALETVRSAVQDAVGPGVFVTRDPAAIGPRVSAQGVAVLVGLPTSTEPSSYRTWLLTVPVDVVFGTPAGPRKLDAAYEVADKVMASEDYLTTGLTSRNVELDPAMTLPAVTVTLQVSTEC